MTTPLTLAETASVFGETLVFGRLLEQADDAESRLALLAETSRARSRPCSARSR
jgi:oligoendopeptidase F